MMKQGQESEHMKKTDALLLLIYPAPAQENFERMWLHAFSL
jgi:hypothetical protein